MKQKSKYEQRKFRILLFLITVVIFSSFYVFYPSARPGLSLDTGDDEFQKGWYFWFDQGEYFKITEAIATGTFSSQDYLYPLGYPILGVPFAILGKLNILFSYHQFFVPNLLLLFGIVFMTFYMIIRLTKIVVFAIIALILLLFFSGYIEWFIEPWTIHILDFGLFGIFYILFRSQQEISNKHLIIAGLLAGWIFSTRFVDLIWVAPMFATFIVFNPKKIKYFFLGFVVIGMVFLSHYVFFDDPLTLPYWYEVATAPGHDQNLIDKTGLERWSFDFKIIERIYCILFDPFYCLPEKSGDEFVDNWWYYALFDKTPILVSSSVFFIFSPPGIYLLFKKTQKYERWILISLIIGFLASILFFTSTYGFTAGWTRFWRYEIFWYPIFTIFSVFGLHFIYQKLSSKIKIKAD